MKKYDIQLYLSPAGSFKVEYSDHALRTLGETVEEVWKEEELQRIRLYAACNGLKCSSDGGTETLRKVMEDRGLFEEIRLVERTQSQKLEVLIDDLETAVMNLDWKQERTRFEELFAKVGGSYGGD